MLAHGAVHVYEMVIPLFVVSWLLEFQTIGLGVASVDVTTASVGVVVTIGYVCFGVGSVPGGVLVDRIGSRWLIGACLLGMGGSYVVLGLAPDMVVVALALLLWGTAASVYHPAGLSLISNGAEDRGTVLAYHGIAGNLGIGLGPLVAAIALVFVGWRILAIALGIPALFAALYALKANFDERAAVEPVDTDGGTEPEPIDSIADFLATSKRLLTGVFVLVFVIAMCSGLYYRGFLTFLPELLRDLPGFEPIAIESLLPQPLRGLLPGGGDGRTLNPQDYFYSGLLLLGVVGQYVGGKLSDRVRVEYGIAVAFAVLAVLALLFLPAAGMGLGPLAVVGALIGVFLFVVQPLYQAAVAEHTTPATRGISYGFTYTGVFGVGALGGAIAGAILTFATVPALFATLAGFAVIASALGLSIARS
jgi:MFS family permease